MPQSRRFSCALVTGASAGLGEEFVLQLAPRVDSFVLVARREDRLNDLSATLRARHPGKLMEVIAADLSRPEDVARILEHLPERGLVPDLLVNNAGLGDYGEFADSDWARVEAMLRVNIEALTRLTHGLLPGMIRRGGGAVVNISSLASTLPIPDIAVYSATKAYVTSFSEALRVELRDYNIPVLAVCPGPVKTEFGEVARRSEEDSIPMNAAFYVSKEQVVAESLAALDADRPRLYPGLKVAIAAAVITALPMFAIRLIISRRPRR
ncbi:SDR family oxidoreductase [Luteolibacter ambystomatis]|uniref:SDR family oxidoreductase n=1 Tax=Luteolibacter ambystomatis TaxID=2824561 RepID=A0A975J1L8_9BACT|nr:SDR family oxidoreductase [Luteolibacter ambystomatis]QUE52366.1 SDR family oxidoreductase [Luteolibacter ambystomatis]